ncbi:MAG: DUF5058 family protein [Oscillospiraceae bacterium]|nr:DUF5058 family protein [Oscillospiraceae bacterium]
MSILSKLNSPVMYLIVAVIIVFVAAVCLFFMIRAYRAGLAIGMDKTKMKRAITASATFAVLPSVGILLGVFALAGSLGTPLPWLRLSVIGALHYETAVAEAAAEAIGLEKLSASLMTPEAFSTIALLMTVCIMWGMLMCIILTKSYTKKLSNPGKNGKPSKFSGFGDSAMTAMFIGLVSAYIGSYIGSFVSADGLFSFSGEWLPIAVSVVAGAVMAIFIWLAEKKKAAWVENFSIAGSMIIAMAAAVVINGIAK